MSGFIVNRPLQPGDVLQTREQAVQQAPDTQGAGYGELCARLFGCARFCRDRQEVKTSELLEEARDAIAELEAEVAAASFQTRVGVWVETCFPPKVVYDRLERRDRLVEEALELAQTLPDFTADRAHALVDYVFSRPVGVTEQESGGVSVTHAALCHAEGIDLQHWAEVELARISAPEVIEKIRAKQAAKPTGLALPVAARNTDGGGK
jgi:hypothetical protein